MDKPFKLIHDDNIRFIFLFTNADSFYVNARHALTFGWISVGVHNAHQSIELYIKAILSLTHEKKWGHDLITLLTTFKTREVYFEELLNDEVKRSLLKELSDAYEPHRYGEAGATSDAKSMIFILDEVAFNLRSIYLRNLGTAGRKIYMPEKLKEDFLSQNKYFSEKDLTKNYFALFGLDFEQPENLST